MGYASDIPFGGDDFLRIADNPAFASRAQRPPKPTREQLFFDRVMYAAGQCVRQGLPVTVETIRMQNAELRAVDVAELLATSKFQAASAARGIDLGPKPGLSSEQLAALAIYTDMSVPLTHAQKLRAAGITDAKWRGWRRQAPFEAELAFLSAENLSHAVQIGEQRLAEMADAGALPAIQFLFQVTNRFVPGKEQVDVRGMLLAVFNILDEEGVDGPVLERVAGKIRVMLGDPVQATATSVQQLEQPLAQPAPELEG